MGPFDVDPGWYENRWYSPEPQKPLWRKPAALAAITAVILAVLYPQTPSAVSSHRLSPPFLRSPTVTNLAAP
jgi:hypothetical protein